MPRVEWGLFAVGNGLDPLLIDAEPRQLVLHGFRPFLAQHKVVLLGPPLVAVTFRRQICAFMIIEPPAHLFEPRQFLRSDGITVILESDILKEVARLLALTPFKLLPLSLPEQPVSLRLRGQILLHDAPSRLFVNLDRLLFVTRTNGRCRAALRSDNLRRTAREESDHNGYKHK